MHYDNIGTCLVTSLSSLGFSGLMWSLYSPIEHELLSLYQRYEHCHISKWILLWQTSTWNWYICSIQKTLTLCFTYNIKHVKHISSDNYKDYSSKTNNILQSCIHGNIKMLHVTGYAMMKYTSLILLNYILLSFENCTCMLFICSSYNFQWIFVQTRAEIELEKINTFF